MNGVLIFRLKVLLVKVGKFLSEYIEFNYQKILVGWIFC